MIRQPTPRLLTPPREEEEVYPYRRVWPSLVIEGLLSFAVAALLLVTTIFLDVEIPERWWPALNLALVLLPVVLWWVFSERPEHRVPQPRRRLGAVVVISALTANAVGVPVIENWIRPDDWLPQADTINRIIGYAFTVGVVQETLKYLVMRFAIWPDHVRTQLDTVAYGAAAALGYATVVNLHFVSEGIPTPTVVATRVFSVIAIHLTGSLAVAYGMSALRYGGVGVLVMPLTLFLAALVTGLTLPLRSGLVNAGIVQGISATNDLFGLGFAFVTLLVPLVAAAFLFTAQERRAREAEESSP